MVGLAMPVGGRRRTTGSGIRRCPSCSAPVRPVIRSPSPTRRWRPPRRPLQATMDLGRQFLVEPRPRQPGAHRVAAGRVRGPQAIEYVIRRGGSQMGVPVLVGRRQTDRPEHRRRAGRRHGRFRLLGSDPVRLRRRRRADPEVLRRPVRHRPARTAVTGQARRPASSTVPAAASTSRSTSATARCWRRRRQRGPGHGQPGADAAGISTVSRATDHRKPDPRRADSPAASMRAGHVDGFRTAWNS